MPAISILVHPDAPDKPLLRPVVLPENSKDSSSNALKPQGLHVVLAREPWSDYFVITQDNGHSEELEVEETRLWFKERGANMDKIESALDQCWNFGHCEVIVDNAHEPAQSKLPYAPKL